MPGWESYSDSKTANLEGGRLGFQTYRNRAGVSDSLSHCGDSSLEREPGEDCVGNTVAATQRKDTTNERYRNDKIPCGRADGYGDDAGAGDLGIRRAGV